MSIRRSTRKEGTYLDPQKRIDQLLDSTGDGTGTTNATTIDEYTYRPALSAISGELHVIMRILVFVQSASNLDKTKYGASALTNGIVITVKNADDAVIHTFNPQPIKMLSHWGLLVGPDVTDGQKTAEIRWTLDKAGEPLALKSGEYLSVNVQDTLTGLTGHIFQVQGYVVDS